MICFCNFSIEWKENYKIYVDYEKCLFFSLINNVWYDK